jgi:hypothetical protein
MAHVMPLRVADSAAWEPAGLVAIE